MPSASSVAKELLRLSFEGEVAEPLTQLRLQKLLYYAQAWSLVTRESELFPEQLQAWQHGPVVPEVYRALPRDQGNRQIAPETFAASPDLDADETRFVGRVWEAYKGFTAYELVRMTHEELPWLQTRGGRSEASHCEDEIPVGAIEAYFARQATPATLAAYLYEFRAEEERAAQAVAARPPLDAARFAALSSRSGH